MGHITLDERESVVALGEYVGRKAKPAFDFAFIDGCHWFQCALTDLWLTSRLLSPSGVIAIDDLWMPAIQRAIEYATKTSGSKSLRPAHGAARTASPSFKSRTMQVNEIGSTSQTLR